MHAQSGGKRRAQQNVAFQRGDDHGAESLPTAANPRIFFDAKLQNQEERSGFGERHGIRRRDDHPEPRRSLDGARDADGRFAPPLRRQNDGIRHPYQENDPLQLLCQARRHSEILSREIESRVKRGE